MWLTIAVIYCIIGLLVGWFMWGVSTSGPAIMQPRGIKRLGGFLLYMGIGQLWLLMILGFMLMSIKVHKDHLDYNKRNDS